jgi:hypothetical protein
VDFKSDRKRGRPLWSREVDLHHTPRKNNTQILLVSAYRICQQTLATLGPTTATMQQFRSLSKKFRTADQAINPELRLQFTLDLQAWLEKKHTEGYSIILGIDANEDLSAESQYKPLHYQLDKPIQPQGHNGSLSTLCKTCGLVDPLTILHPDSPSPPTYSRGTK